MKSEERHKLKTNELEETINKELQYVRDHWQQGLTVVGVVLIVIAGYMWVSQMMASSKKANHEQLHNAMLNLELMKYQASQKASLGDGSQDDLSNAPDVDAVKIIATLNELSDSDVGMMATLQKAEAIRAQLYFTTDDLPEAKKAEICKSAGDLYQQVVNDYGKYPLAVGAASVGLGLIAEEKGDLAEAQKIYQAIIDDKDNQFAGTIYPAQAEKRLEQLKDFDLTIKFEPAPIEPAGPAEDKGTVDDNSGTQATATSNDDSAAKTTTGTEKPEDKPAADDKGSDAGKDTGETKEKTAE